MTSLNPINVDVFAQWLAIDPSSPSWLCWASSPNSRIAPGSSAGGMSKSGYYKVKLHGKWYKAHRIVYALSAGVDPGDRLIDHIDRNPANNDPANLRLVSTRGNCHNRKDQSLYGPGVTFRQGKYRAQIRIDGKIVFLDQWSDPAPAKAAYREALKDLCEPEVLS